MKVGILQQRVTEDVKANMRHIAEGIERLADDGAQLVVLQELHNSLYFCQTEDVDNFNLAEPVPGPSTEFYGGLARRFGVVIVTSLFEKRAAGLYHNTAVVMERDGSIAGKYRKMHIPDDPAYYEKFYFTPGDIGFHPIDTSVGRLGVLVCWDQWYPEAARLMALQGAEILVYPTAIGYADSDTPDEQERQREAWTTVQRGHAVANGLPVVTANRVGFEPDPSGQTKGISFWGSSMSADKLSAYQTLYVCLETVARLMAPIAPFYADRLYMDLTSVTGRDNVVSVHLANFPVADESLIDKELEARMQMAQDVTSMVLALRRKVNIKVRQPLQCIMVPVVDEEQRRHIEAVKDLIMSEVNVKELRFVEGDSGVLVKRVKCDFKKLGPKFGKQMKAVAAAVSGMTQEEIARLEREGSYTFILDGAEAVVEAADVDIFSEDIPGWLVANEGRLTVALEVTVTDELRREGIARELVNRIQNIRKSSGFEITDKIDIVLSKNPNTDDAVTEYNTYICNQVLANSLTLADEVADATELSFDDYSLMIKVTKL